MASADDGKGAKPPGGPFRSEPESVAFISSVMSAELKPIREQVRSALEAASNIVPWAFETSPASSEGIGEDYLRKVREAVFVIWLASGSTTDPVAAEVGEALAANRRLLVFVLPADSRDERTVALLARVRDAVHYRELEETSAIGAEVTAAVGDEISRALADRPSPSKAKQLSDLWRESHARAVQKWQAAGLGSDLALRLSGEADLGSLAEQLLPGPQRPLTVLVGEAGTGKSLACERFIQAAIAAAEEDAGAPVPAFLTAARATGELQGALAEAMAGLGEPAVQGARVVIDAADEAGERSSELLAEARELVRKWPDTRVLLSTRPLAAYKEIEERTAMPAVSEAEALEIVSIAAGRSVSIGEHAAWSEPLKEAAKVPLFALLIGERLRRSGELHGSRTELLAELAERSLGSQGEQSKALLRELAVLSIERGGARVALSELGGPGRSRELQASRLVVVEDGMAWFPLALTAQWLAAESLAEGTPSGERLAEDARDLELWRFPLAMLIANYSHEQVSAILGPLAARHPGFASQVVEESIARWSGGQASTPPLAEAGIRIREAMPRWLAGFGPLADFLLPGFDRESGRLPTLGVAQEERNLLAGWYEGEEELGEVTRLPIELFYSGSETPDAQGWGRARSHAPAPQAAWAWRWSLEEASSTLKRALNERTLPVAGTRLEQARVWLASLAVLGAANSHAEALPIERVRRRAEELAPEADPKLRGHGDHAIDLGRLIEILDRLEAEGLETVAVERLEVEPTGRLLVPKSAHDGVLQGKVAAVYQAALETYEELSSGLFSGLAPFMPIAATLPGRLEGHLYGGERDWPRSFEWTIYALPYGEASRAEITLTKGNDRELLDRWRQDWVENADSATKSLKALRPEQSRWLGMGFSDHLWSGIGHLAMEEVVYEWLWRDLSAVKLVEGTLGDGHYPTIP